MQISSPQINISHLEIANAILARILIKGLPATKLLTAGGVSQIEALDSSCFIKLI